MTGQLNVQQDQQQKQQQQQQQEQNSFAMANMASDHNNLDLPELQEILHILWGDDIRLDVFQRWSQGFVFSDIEPSALVQKQGGPCAVIAPVQAYLLKFVISEMPGQLLKDLTKEKCHSLLIEAVCNILSNCRKPVIRLVTIRAGEYIRRQQQQFKMQTKFKTQNKSLTAAIASSSSKFLKAAASDAGADPGASETNPKCETGASAKATCSSLASGIIVNATVTSSAAAAISIDVATDEDSEMLDISAASVIATPQQQQQEQQSQPLQETSAAAGEAGGAAGPSSTEDIADKSATASAESAQAQAATIASLAAAAALAVLEEGATSAASLVEQDYLNYAINDDSGLFLTPDEFHESLTTIHFNDIEDVRRFFTENLNQLTSDYGVLLFLYSVFLTKGLADVNADLTDTSEPLIHNTFGYGAQGLINLMLTGRAVGHVWDNDQDVGGLKLHGISEQSDIGFITIMEQLRYCTVGSFFKNPRYPVWVMGSDTHLTVIFSREKRLVSPETPSELGRRVFKSFDPEGNNFIPTSALQDVLATLNLVSDPAYVSLMQKRLDPENLGIILLNAFMDEFYHIEKHSTPDTFELLHYNGIPGSNLHNRVRYYVGSAILLEADIKALYSANPIVTCLQTKWPNIDVSWHDSFMPTLN